MWEEGHISPTGLQQDRIKLCITGCFSAELTFNVPPSAFSTYTGALIPFSGKTALTLSENFRKVLLTAEFK
jgi:hypothetical protein